MLIDEVLPRWDVASRHQIDIEAPGSVTYRAFRQLDIARSPVVPLLFALRSLPLVFMGKTRPTRSMTIEAMLDLGFVILAEEPDHELVIGAIGKFWWPTGNLLAIDPGDFSATDPAGFAKGVMNVAVTPRGEAGCLVTTETRVLCMDRAARRRFSLYWHLVGPFSGSIRHALLRDLKRTTESSTGFPFPDRESDPSGRGDN